MVDAGLALPETSIAPLATDQVIVLRGVTWADYQRLLEIRGDGSVPRLTYLEGSLELMRPSKPHALIKAMLGRLVEAFCLERGVDITPYGSWTLESKESERGAEPDECYLLGGREEEDRPDLAIEVIWTSGGLDKLEVYRKLRVAEVWIWREGRIEIFALRGERYEPITHSELLPALDFDVLVGFLGVRPMTRAIREYRALLKGADDDESASK